MEVWGSRMDSSRCARFRSSSTQGTRQPSANARLRFKLKLFRHLKILLRCISAPLWVKQLLNRHCCRAVQATAAVVQFIHKCNESSRKVATKREGAGREGGREGAKQRETA